MKACSGMSLVLGFVKKSLFAALLCSFVLSAFSQNLPKIEVVESVWNGISRQQQSQLMSKFDSIEIVPSSTVGVVQSVQSVNRTVAASNSGARSGAELAGARYVDRANKRDGSYSATQHLKNEKLGAALGSILDAPANIKFVVNYGVKTLDGQLREIRVETSDEFARPLGQCVFVPSMDRADSQLCAADVGAFLSKIESLSSVPSGAKVNMPSSGINVKCRVPGAGLMTLEKNACIQMEGVIEK